MYLFYDATEEFLFTENETNFQRLYGSENYSPFVKDSFHTYIVSGDKSATNPGLRGTKVAPVYRIKLGRRGIPNGVSPTRLGFGMG